MSRKMFLNQQDVHKLVMCVNYYQIIQAAYFFTVLMNSIVFCVIFDNHEERSKANHFRNKKSHALKTMQNFENNSKIKFFVCEDFHKI